MPSRRDARKCNTLDVDRFQRGFMVRGAFRNPPMLKPLAFAAALLTSNAAYAQVPDLLAKIGHIVIPRSRDNPEFCWVYDTEIVSHLIAPGVPVFRHVLAEECQHGDAEILKAGVAFVVSDVPMHQAP